MAEKPRHGKLAQRIEALEQEKLEYLSMKAPTAQDDDCPLHKIESKMNPEIHIPDVDLGTIINSEEIQSIMDDFHYLTKMATAILDLKGNVIEATGWQDMCTKFHRMNPKTAQYCTESDLFLAKNLKPGEYVDYKCKNGLWDVVTPLFVGTKHLGNVYAGQFFYNDEQMDENYFIKQAEEYGFDKNSYLDAFRRIPVYNRETVNHLMSFLIKFASYISKISLFNIQLEQEIHERRAAQKEISKLNQDLELRVHQRTTQLENSNRELESFAYIASHDLQEPLRKVQAFSDRLKTKYAGVLDERGKDYLTRMESAGRRMQAMVNDLLTFSRVKTKGEDFVTINLSDIVKDVIVDLEVRIKETNASIEIGDLPSIEADPSQMHQLFLNLISNAIKFCPENISPYVRIFSNDNVTHVSDTTPLCEMIVQDNGIGFEEQYLDRIFKPFQRLHGKEKYKGTGIGLSICLRIIERHCGRITAESIVGQGSKFIITLPIQQNKEE